MAFTLGFHIILVPFGVAFTFLMMLANYRDIRRGDSDALVLAERRSKVAAVLFAVGAVSGTVLSFELGLLWPAAAREVFHKEPAKFATMEMLSVTGDHVPRGSWACCRPMGRCATGSPSPAARRCSPGSAGPPASRAWTRFLPNCGPDPAWRPSSTGRSTSWWARGSCCWGLRCGSAWCGGAAATSREADGSCDARR
jgi:hypothetical protein